MVVHSQSWVSEAVLDHSFDRVACGFEVCTGTVYLLQVLAITSSLSNVDEN